MSEKMTPDGWDEDSNYTFVFDMNNPAIKLLSLASTAKFLPFEYLENYLRDFVETERYEEAAVIKKEIDSRGPKYKLYLTAPDGKMTDLKVVGDIEFPKFKP